MKQTHCPINKSKICDEKAKIPRFCFARSQDLGEKPWSGHSGHDCVQSRYAISLPKAI